MSTPYNRPLPGITPANKPYWDGAREHRLMLPRCDSCAMTWLPPSPVCPRCMDEGISWYQSSGRGRVISWVIYHKAYFAGYVAAIPYHVVMVELEEGPRLVANVVDVANDALFDGMPVEVIFDAVTPEITLPRFRAAQPVSPKGEGRQ